MKDVTQIEVLEAVEYAIRKIKQGTKGISIEVRDDFISITEATEVQSKDKVTQISVDEFTYTPTKDGKFKETVNLDQKQDV